jgi:hypothetical protein
MRFPSLKEDYWELRSGEASQMANPDKFWLPPREERENLKRGQSIKLIFEIEGENEDGSVEVLGERMWVIVSEIHDGYYIGILDNPPALIEGAEDVYLCFGAEIPFRPEHVIDIADPPPDYVEWKLSKEPERKWPRN